ncbi:hypothetical protein [Desulfovibrio sp. JC010]|uniref:hypothetical protein n=1 Tax=Desulfovibrio sp. JC010 TaxID=2593641 RepID=UPI0013D61A62|nr:hypothetical protein [Desulfovibrio sp. JC010]NDV28199.1 hypothetical protein [Desulfovibrio sp. JC010]
MSRLNRSSLLKLGIPTLEDVDLVAANIRESDRHDLEGLHPGKAIREIIMGDVEYSQLVYGLYSNDRMQCVFGVIPVAPGVGTPWVVGTAEVDEAPLLFARSSRRLLDMLQRNFPVLDTWVCAENSKSVLWHKWCGFEFEQEKVRLGRDEYYRALRRADTNMMEVG